MDGEKEERVTGVGVKRRLVVGQVNSGIPKFGEIMNFQVRTPNFCKTLIILFFQLRECRWKGTQNLKRVQRQKEMKCLSHFCS